MKMNLKTVAIIYSTNTSSEVTIIEMIGNNKYLAEYKNRICAAMFNPFSGTFYVDDIHGKDAEEFYNGEGDLQYELNYLFDVNQRELDAYRKLGSVQHLKHLREKEIRRNRQCRLVKKIARTVVTFSGVAFCIWAFVSGIVSIIA